MLYPSFVRGVTTRLFVVASLAGWCVAPLPSLALGLFQVGNSFTFDSKPEGTAAMLAAALGTEVDLGYHVRGNQSLDSLWFNPTAGGTETTDFGDHTVALPNNHWDFLTLQTFQTLSSQNTLGQEVARIQDFVGAADQGSGGETQIVIYGPWAGRGDSSWQRWDDEILPDPEIRVAYSAQYHDVLYDEVEALYPGRVRLASAGKVIREIRARIDGGEGPLEMKRDLYRDTLHLSEVGRFVASTTMFTTITGLSPVGMPVPRDTLDWDESEFSDELALELQQIVWEVVTADRRSGVSPVGDLNVDTVLSEADGEAWRAAHGAKTDLSADFNSDRVVDELDEQIMAQALSLGASDINTDGILSVADLFAWQASYGGQGGVADVNADGLVNAADYTVWRDAYNATLAVDLNGDGIGTSADQDILQSQLGWAKFLPQDANGDGVVNAADYTIWRDSLESAASPAGVPEPAACLMAFMTLLAACRRRVVA